MPDENDRQAEERALKALYAEREATGRGANYAQFDISNQMAIDQMRLVASQLFRQFGLNTLSNMEILDVGCGSGLNLLRLMLWGGQPSHLHGIDLIDDRVVSARLIHPAMDIRVGNATQLPWADGQFDLVAQSTMFTSILSADTRRRAAAEMDRVLKPSGLVLWYDFWTNPFNRHTHPINSAELRSLFPGYAGRLRRVTLAPPISRRVAGHSLLLAHLLQHVPWLQSHLVAVLRKPTPSMLEGEVAPQN